MTHQEIFDQVWRGIMTQGRLSFVRGEGAMLCRYHSQTEGTRCAIGLLLTESQADLADSERMTIDNLLSEGMLPPLDRAPAFYRQLQAAHDNAVCLHDDPGAQLLEWFNAMRRIARTHNLNFPEFQP